MLMYSHYTNDLTLKLNIQKSRISFLNSVLPLGLPYFPVFHFPVIFNTFPCLIAAEVVGSNPVASTLGRGTGNQN